MINWISERIKEPSSWAAVSIITVSAGVLIDQPLVIMVAVGAAAIAFVLREKGII